MNLPLKVNKSVVWPLFLIISAAVSASILWGGVADTVFGCCSRHKGVCDCQCCDGSPLCDNCLFRMPECGVTEKGVKKSKKKSRSKKQEADLPATFVAMVTKIKDGDTIVVEFQKQQISIRLADIDCPEFKQPFGIEALEFTQSRVMNQNVEVQVRATDRYGRTVADVVIKEGHSPNATGTSLNAALLKEGFAWWYRYYSNNKTLEALEKEARDAKRGLWSRPNPIPPWVYRRNQRKET